MKIRLCPFWLFISLLFFFSLPVKNTVAQSVAINTDGSTADATAILDVKSTGKGMLIPRLTTVQRTAIATPATGLLVFDTNTNAFWFYNGTAWTKLEATGANWSVTGNSGTTAGTHFIGAADAVDVVFKTSNIERMRLLGVANSTNSIATITGGDWDVNSITIGRGSGNIATNTANGYQALFSNSTGFYNTAMGYRSLHFNTTGGYNTANGYNSLYANTTGIANTANGYNSLFFNSTGDHNTALGYQSLYFNTTGIANTANGSYSLYTNTTGDYNTANGSYSLYSNTTGSYNTANGHSSLFSNTTGNHNTANGYNSLYSNTTADYNTANGINSMYSNTTGDFNTANGYNSLFANTTGHTNTAIGYRSLYSNTTGYYNIAIGTNSLYSNTTGHTNTAIGYNANVSTGALTNATAIGYNAVVNASDKVVIGNSFVTVIGGQVGWSTLSDGRFKTNIKKDVPGLDFIMQLNPVNYNFMPRKFEEHLRQNVPDSVKNASAKRAINYSAAENILHTGFIAQEVEQVVIKNGYKFNGVHAPVNATDNYSITYDEFVVPLVKAVQEQQQQIEQQKKMISEQQKVLEALKKRLDKLEQQ